MERHWKRIYQSVVWNEIQDLRIRSFTHHGKLLTKRQQERIDKRLTELYPVYEKFVEMYGNDSFYSEDTDKIRDRFSEFVRQWEKGQKIRKIMGKIKKDVP